MTNRVKRHPNVCVPIQQVHGNTVTQWGEMMPLLVAAWSSLPQCLLLAHAVFTG